MLKEIDGSLAEETYVIEGMSAVEQKRKDILLECVLKYFRNHYPMECERIGLNGFGSNAQLLADALGVSLVDDAPQARPDLTEDFKRMLVSSLLEILESAKFPEVSVRYGPFKQTTANGSWISAICRDLHRRLEEAKLPRGQIPERIDRPDDMDFRR